MDNNLSCRARRTSSFAAAAASALVLSNGMAMGAQEHVKTLVTFGNLPDPHLPTAGLVLGPDGNLYGTSFYGGDANFGTVFKVTPKGEMTVIYSFEGGSDGAYPSAQLLVGQDGNLYGTTEYGGGAACPQLVMGPGCGTVFKVTLQGTESILYAFQGQGDGLIPTGAVIQVASGDLYGTTNGGGLANSGVMFHIEPDGTEETIHQFNYAVEGAVPGTPILGHDGNFYVLLGSGFGSFARVTPTGDTTLVYTFAQVPGDAAFPNGILTRDAEGNFYGTAPYGGAEGFGVVFKLTPAGEEQIVYSFSGGDDGSRPNGPVLLATNGLMYGTTTYGGSKNYGVIYELSPEGAQSVVHTFKLPTYTPVQGNGIGLVEGKHHYIYGATTGGGGQITPDWLGSVIRFKARE